MRKALRKSKQEKQAVKKAIKKTTKTKPADKAGGKMSDKLAELRKSPPKKAKANAAPAKKAAQPAAKKAAKPAAAKRPAKNRKAFHTLTAEFPGGTAAYPPQILEHAVAAFGDEKKALHWLSAPLAHLGGRAPSDLLTSADGVVLVGGILTRIEHNIFSDTVAPDLPAGAPAAEEPAPVSPAPPPEAALAPAGAPETVLHGPVGKAGVQKNFFGARTTAVLQWMGKNGFSTTEAKQALEHFGGTAADSTLRTFVSAGKRGGKTGHAIAELAEEHASELLGYLEQLRAPAVSAAV